MEEVSTGEHPEPKVGAMLMSKVIHSIMVVMMVMGMGMVMIMAQWMNWTFELLPLLLQKINAFAVAVHPVQIVLQV
jgi:hypothetical protein